MNMQPQDRRRLKSNGTVAHSSLQGQVEAERFIDGQLSQIIAPAAILYDAPGGARDRELLFGAGFTVLEEDHESGYAFGFVLRDDYVGYIRLGEYGPLTQPATHVVASRLTYALPEPDFKTQGEHFPLHLGARVRATGGNGRWMEIDGARFVPSGHLRAVDATEKDPVAVADRLLGAPYVWGGNTSEGVDCSGLVQAACRACGIACPGDADMQEAELGAPLAPDAPLQRGDLLFWKGHVAWVADPETLIHANAFHMAVSYEPLQEAITRIEAQGDGPVTSRKRLEITP